MADKRGTLIKIAYIALGVAISLLLLYFALPWLAPFILALLTARLIEPGVDGMSDKWRIKRCFSSAFFSTLFLGAVGSVLALIITVTVSEAGDFIKNLPELVKQFGTMFEKMENALYGFTAAAPLETQTMIKNVIGSVIDMIYQLPTLLSTYLLDFAASVASATPKILLFTLTYIISVYFMSGSYPDIIAFIRKQLPDRWRSRAETLKSDSFTALGKWFKAQLMLMCVTFVILAVSLTILRISNGIFFALLISLIDALPVFGTGTVLIPWTVLTFIGGNSPLGIGLALTYGLVSVVRSFLEPRLVGNQLGIHPVATLIAMYVGFCTMGVTGMILFPLALVFLMQFHDRGYFKLWK